MNRSRQTVNVSRRKCVKWRKNRHISLHLHSSTSSLWSPQGSGGIPLARKMCYAVGGVPYQMTTVAMGLSLQIFLLDVVQVKTYYFLTIPCTYQDFKVKHISISQMEASYVSMILFVSRAWDAVSDPLVGYLVGRSNWTPIGKLTPWSVGGATC